MTHQQNIQNAIIYYRRLDNEKPKDEVIEEEVIESKPEADIQEPADIPIVEEPGDKIDPIDPPIWGKCRKALSFFWNRLSDI